MRKFDEEESHYLSDPKFQGDSYDDRWKRRGGFEAGWVARENDCILQKKLISAIEIALGDILYLANERNELSRFKGTTDMLAALIKSA